MAVKKWKDLKKSEKVAGVFLVIIIVVALAAIPKTSDTNQNSNDSQTSGAEAPKNEMLLNASVKKAIDIPGVEITNLEASAWEDCELELNNVYMRIIRNPLEPNEPLNNPYPLFTKSDGTRFDADDTAAMSLKVTCKVNGSTRSNYFVF